MHFEDKKSGFSAKIKNHPWAQAAGDLTDLIKDSLSAKVIIGAMTLGSIGFGFSHSYFSEKSSRIPLAFSEVGKTKRKLRREGKEVPPLTRYYSITNDVVMKVFEAKNLSYGVVGTSAESFANQLEYKMDRSFKVHALIPEYTKEIPEVAKASLKVLEPFTAAKNDLTAVVNELEKTWDESHNDQYRTEISYDTQCDGDGKNCQTVTKITQVYDHTDHSYTYNKAHGESAARLLKGFSTKHPELKLSENLILATSTEADNEYAIYKSMKDRFSEKMPTVEEYVALTNTWANGSTLNKHIPGIHQNYNSIKSNTPAWQKAKNTAHNEKYSTGSSSDAGPQEYQISESILKNSKEMQAAVTNITQSINHTVQKAPVLEKTAQEFIDVAIHYKKGGKDKDELAKEVMILAKDLYKENFSNGFDVEPYKAGYVLLWTMLGLAAGAAAGLGSHNILEKKEKYHKPYF